MPKAELVFIPSPGRGHLQAAFQLATLLVDRDPRLSVTVLVIAPFSALKSHRESPANSSRIRFVDVPPSGFSPSSEMAKSPFSVLQSFISSHRENVMKEVEKLRVVGSGTHYKLAGFVVDMFCAAMIDVAEAFSVPAYVFFTSGASFLGLMIQLHRLIWEQKLDLMEIKNAVEKDSVPSYETPFPARVLPKGTFWLPDGPKFYGLTEDFKRARGILINTFLELETHGINSLSGEQKFPPVYPIGPLIYLENDDKNPEFLEIMNWLDEQPDSSVVFLCFGSMGSFDGDQVKEIAAGLERSGHRFLWSLRKPPAAGTFSKPGEYENYDEILPEGFLQRSAEIGKVIGWAPQVAVLSHRAVGGFVSHCGWNSILESLWFGVPIAAWPMYAEQQTNAFQLLKDLEVAVEIKMDYYKNFYDSGDESGIVKADEIDGGIRKLMDSGNHRLRAVVKAMKEKFRAALSENGSSSNYIRSFLEDSIS
ncbi:hypothetical protein M569_11899 [Genlisea aurea]|uniref:Glycosyltransferase n=1 Tax=Genlisea aurea TaxID=192259 RepID=S8C816_9LAMI|nr:hypothetical protein M569_11899 [Genlisea aurea]